MPTDNGATLRKAALSEDCIKDLVRPLRDAGWSVEVSEPEESGLYITVVATAAGERFGAALLFSCGTRNDIYRQLAESCDAILYREAPQAGPVRVRDKCACWPGSGLAATQAGTARAATPLKPPSTGHFRAKSNVVRSRAVGTQAPTPWPLRRRSNCLSHSMTFGGALRRRAAASMRSDDWGLRNWYRSVGHLDHHLAASVASRGE